MSSNHDSSSGTTNGGITPSRLELSLNPIDGSLQTAPLSSVLLASTDSLYSDLYNMAHGELDVTSATVHAEDADANQQDEDDTQPMHPQPQHQLKKERMSNLSFAQRRHELAWRLSQHAKSVQHVSALCAASSVSDIATTVRVSSAALQHARTAWVQADEAQDALYFFHAQLFPARAAPHDVYGALDILLQGRWYDLPKDLRLSVDRYETSKESLESRTEIEKSWHLVVRDKLLRGEVGWMKRQEITSLWQVSLRGGTVRLTQGNPKALGTSSTLSHPIEAILTVLSTNDDPEWTLLSIEVKVQAKTGEFNHQLETSNRQRYDLHRLAALSMSREEALMRKERENDKGKEKPAVARPLHRLFQVVHNFSLSWQLEVLSAQAQALRRGVWAATMLSSYPITVTPVRFFDNEEGILGAVSISFWKVDDTYGPPSISDLALDKRSESTNGFLGTKHYGKVTSQLTLTIRAEPDAGIKVSLSGAAGISGLIATQANLRSTARDLLEASSNPFCLSASDALLAATRLCAEQKCWAVVDALQPPKSSFFLPSWIFLAVDGGSIAVKVKIHYHGVTESSPSSVLPVIFRLVCDARTGSFVPTFPRSTSMLRNLASNETYSSEAMALQIAGLPPNRRRAAGARFSGRVVKDAFDGLTRTMNLLGQRVGVGVYWDDIDDKAPSLRDRSIQSACCDVRVSMTKCCGMTALYGVAPLALGSATGLDAQPDM
jgi:hypothetical protein